MEKTYRRLAKPYLVWLYILALLPMLIMFVLMFLDSEGLDFNESKFTLSNFSQLAEKSTLLAFGNSILLAILCTIVCILLGYVVAYKLTRSHIKNKFLVLTILILPMWSNILLRTEALGNIMEPNNIISDLLNGIGINISVDIKGSFLGVMIGLIFTYLPFMILPIYTALEKIDISLEEAALDLGLTDFQKFWKVILPLSSKGIITGSIMVFLPCLSSFAIPEILGDGNILAIGSVIEQSFRNMNYNVGSLLAIIILLFVTSSIIIANKIDKEGETLI